MRHTYQICLFLFWSVTLLGQVTYTANNLVLDYKGHFGYGTNVGYYPNWTARQLGDIAIGNSAEGVVGLGVTTMRPALFEFFQEQWGYDFRIPAFEHYKKLGAVDNVVFVGYPSEEHRDTTYYCPDHRSELFLNMYEPIWDDGTDGTPYNEQNYYAAYLYKTVTLYKDYVKFWEIWNEPDYSFSANSIYDENQPESWWNVPPSPCEFDIHAPIFHYIRLLRISYEIIKTVDPTAYVAIGGIGYPSFLDAVLRYTDNPDEGKISPDFPNQGGAYFDVLSFHSYPHIDSSLRTWSNKIFGFVNQRHTDAAVEGVLRLRNRMEEVLFKHYYNGTIYPKKEWIITECNVPRVPINQGFGSDEVQRNFIIKTLVECQKHNIHQFHIYTLGDQKEENEIEYLFQEYDIMGLMGNMMEAKPYQVKPNAVGIAYKTTSDLLYGKRFDHKTWEALELPEGIKGGVFTDDKDEKTYVLWARTQADGSEEAIQVINLRELIGIKQLVRYDWNFSATQQAKVIDARYVALEGAPIFLTDAAKDSTKPIAIETNAMGLNVYPNPVYGKVTILFSLIEDEIVNLSLINTIGQTVKVLLEQEPMSANAYQWKTTIDNVPQGIYYLRLSTPKTVSTIPLVVLSEGY